MRRRARVGCMYTYKYLFALQPSVCILVRVHPVPVGSQQPGLLRLTDAIIFSLFFGPYPPRAYTSKELVPLPGNTTFWTLMWPSMGGYIPGQGDALVPILAVLRTTYFEVETMYQVSVYT